MDRADETAVPARALTPPGGRSTGADPAALRAAVAGGAGAVFALDRAVEAVRRATLAYHRSCDHLGGVRDDVVHALAAALVDALLALDRWTLQVADALRAVDRGDVPGVRAALVAGLLDTAALARVGGDPRLELPLRSDAWRAAATVHAAGLARRVDQQRDAEARRRATRTPWQRLQERLDRLVADVVLRPLGLLVELAPDTAATRAARLHADAVGLRSLLAQPGLSWLAASGRGDGPGGRATARVALGDPTTATHVVVLVPGTGSGVAAPLRALADARALHAAASAAAPPHTRVATVLDLHDAPPTLVEAALAGHAAAAAPALAAGVSGLVAANPGAEVTVVGHSHGGAVAGAAVAAGMPVDDLVLLGAPGASVAHAGELPLRPGGGVWSALAPRDPIGLVPLLDPLLGPRAVHGPLPVGPGFGARPLAVDGRHLTHGPSLHAPQVTGHLRYLEPGSFALSNVARIAVGLPPWPPPRGTAPGNPAPDPATPAPAAPGRATRDSKTTGSATTSSADGRGRTLAEGPRATAGDGR